MPVNLPLTGAGGTTASVATEQIGGAEYQYMKLVDGQSASTLMAAVEATTPSSADGGLVVRPIGSTAFSQAAVLVAGSSANMIGSMALAAGTTNNTIGSAALVAGSSANTIGSVGLISGSSANILGQAALIAGTSANFQYMQSIPFSSGNVARSSVSTTVDIQIIAANANRKALVIANRSTAQTVGIGYSTAILTTALANVDLFLAPSSVLSFGLQGGLPLYLGPMRGINLTSTTVAGSVATIEFT